MVRKIDYALEYAGRGWKVLALAPGTKIPAKHFMQEHGVLDATSNAVHIRQIWDDLPEANIGIATGKASGITVLDLDSEEAKNEMKNISVVQPPVTYCVKTPRGWHIYFQYDETVEQSAGRVPKVDTRNDGGYVVAAGSVVDGVTYSVVVDKPVAAWDFPDLFKANAPGSNQPSVNRDRKDRVSLVLTQGSDDGTRNADTFDVAMHFRGKGYSGEELSVLVHTHNQTKNRPPLPDRDIDKIIRSAERYELGEKLEYLGALKDPPLIEAQTDRRITFYWSLTGIRIALSEIHRIGNRTYAKTIVDVRDDKDIEGRALIYLAVVSLFDTRSRNDARQLLRERVPLADWAGMLTYIAQVVDTNSARPAKIIDLSKHKPKRESAYLVYPVVRQNQPTIIYADGGTGKSTFSLALACIAAAGQSFIPGIQPTAKKPVRTLFLDWESDEDDSAEMLQEIKAGSGLNMPPGAWDDYINYQSMSGAFIDHVDSLVPEIVERGIELIVIDSLVMSAGGDVTDAEAARQYYNAVRSLNVASVGITHTNKAGSLYGNRFFWNGARQVFRLTSVSESETDPMLGLYHEKANRSQLVAPMAWNVRFAKLGATDPFIKYESADIQSIPELAKGTGLRDRLIGLLRNQPFSVEELAERLNESDVTVLVTLQRFPDVFVKRYGMDNDWELADE